MHLLRILITKADNPSYTVDMQDLLSIRLNTVAANIWLLRGNDGWMSDEVRAVILKAFDYDKTSEGEITKIRLILHP